jgi:membrane-bound lytic murein transglycosylase D
MEEPFLMWKRLHRAALGTSLLVLLLTGCASLPGEVADRPTPPIPTEPVAARSPAPLPAPTAASAPAPATAAAALPAELPATLPPSVAEPPPPAAPTPVVEPAPLLEGDRSDLWDRMRKRMAIADLSGPRVQRWEQHYASRPDYVERMVERGSRYLFHVVQEVEKRGLPAELALLPFIESAFNPQALSRARASGLWQFMPATGQDFELRQNLFRDDRRAVLASTGAALDYLERLHQRFGDWHLALAAYNWGQGNVSRAITRNQRARKPTDYLSLAMPAETRDYVPKLQAVKNIVMQPERFGLVLPALQNHPFFARVRIERDIDVGLAAELAEVPLDDFLALNPQLNKPVILAAGTPEVLLPWDQAEGFSSRLAAASGPLASWTAWVAPRNLSVAEAARLVGLSEAELREANRIPSGVRVREGSTLIVPRPASQDDDVSAQVADKAQLLLAPESRGQRRINVRIGRGGESVASVARRHRVSAAQVARWNGVGTGGRFRAGQTVLVMKDLPAAQRKAVARKPVARTARTARTARAAPKATAKSQAKAAAKPAQRRVAAGSSNTRR